MRVIKIKNLQDVTDFYEFVNINSGEYYTIADEHERQRIADSLKVYQHLFSDPAKILINDGNSDLTNPIDGLCWLKSDIDKVKIDYEPAFTSKTTIDGHKLFRRKHGFSITIPANSSNEVKFNVPYPMAKINKAEVVGGHIGDYVDFKVYDTPSGDISGYPDVLLNQFGFNVYIAEGFYEDVSNYDADLIEDMKVGVTYYNTSSSQVTIYINLTLHQTVDP
jgi:hypothetical protein